MKIIETQGDDLLAKVFIASTDDGSLIEFVESVQPPLPRDKKWVLIVSTLKGCPINCPICDAGLKYGGKLSKGEIISQIDYLIRRRFPDGRVNIPLVKIQFARMGDPAFNSAVLDVLKELKNIYEIPGLMPSISTVAPVNSLNFLKELKDIKDELYADGKFQMQFSVHTTCDIERRKLVPAKTLSLKDIAKQGEEFFKKGDRKITLNFALVDGYPASPSVISDYFDPEKFILKLTPVNPTISSAKAGLYGAIDPDNDKSWIPLKQSFEEIGFDVIVSIGEQRENQIGSNCGMYVSTKRVEAC
ncbi:MAG: radical SAM protein [Deltaproteobacteria bacterium]|nr:radical SAM protein [Deltaproteobacteria bacterium]